MRLVSRTFEFLCTGDVLSFNFPFEEAPSRSFCFLVHGAEFLFDWNRNGTMP